MSATVAAGHPANAVLTVHSNRMVETAAAPNPTFKFLIFEQIFSPQLIVESDFILKTKPFYNT